MCQLPRVTELSSPGPEGMEQASAGDVRPPARPTDKNQAGEMHEKITLTKEGEVSLPSSSGHLPTSVTQRFFRESSLTLKAESSTPPCSPRSYPDLKYRISFCYVISGQFN